MLSKLTNWIIGREPVATATGVAGGVAAAIGVLTAFDLVDISVEQTAAIAALVAWVAGFAARRAVTPVAGLSDVTRAIEGIDRPGDERGGVVPALVLAVVGVIVVAWLVGDACFSDEDEPGDLGLARTEENSPCEGDCSGRQRHGCADAKGPCEDNDLNGNRVIVCLPESRCSFGEAEAAMDTPPLCPPVGIPPVLPHCDPSPT